MSSRKSIYRFILRLVSIILIHALILSDIAFAFPETKSHALAAWTRFPQTKYPLPSTPPHEDASLYGPGPYRAPDQVRNDRSEIAPQAPATTESVPQGAESGSSEGRGMRDEGRKGQDHAAEGELERFQSDKGIKNKIAIRGIMCNLTAGFHVAPSGIIADRVMSIYAMTGIEVRINKCGSTSKPDFISVDELMSAFRQKLLYKELSPSLKLALGVTESDWTATLLEDENRIMFGLQKWLIRYLLGLAIMPKGEDGSSYDIEVIGDYSEGILTDIARFMRDYSREEILLEPKMEEMEQERYDSTNRRYRERFEGIMERAIKAKSEAVDAVNLPAKIANGQAAAESAAPSETGVTRDDGRGTIDDKVAEGTVTELPPTDFEPSSGRKEKRWKPIRSGTPETSPETGVTSVESLTSKKPYPESSNIQYDQLWVSLTNYCPLAPVCTMCFIQAVSERQRSMNLTDDDIEKIIYYSKKKSFRQLSLTGGEPMTEIDKVLKLIRETRVDSVEITTNNFFSTTAERAEETLDLLSEAMFSRAKNSMRPLKNLVIRVSVDEFHIKGVPLENHIHLVNLIEKYRDSKYKGMEFRIRGMLTAGNPIPSLVKRLGGRISIRNRLNPVAPRKITLPSGLTFIAEYGTLYLTGTERDKNIIVEKYWRLKPFTLIILKVIRYIIGATNDGVTVNVSYDGMISIKEQLTKVLPLANIRDTDFVEKIEERLVSDPLLVALRKEGIGIILKILKPMNTGIEEKALRANNLLLVISGLMEDPDLRNRVYTQLYEIGRSKGWLSNSILKNSTVENREKIGQNGVVPQNITPPPAGRAAELEASKTSPRAKLALLIAVITIIETVLFVALQHPILSVPLPYPLNFISLKVVLGFVTFMTLGDIFSQTIHLVKKDNVKLKNIPRSIKWKSVATVFFSVTFLFSWFWPMTYILWTNTLPLWLIGVADQTVPGVITFFIFFFLRSLVEKEPLSGKSTEMRKALLIAYLYWATAFTAIFFLAPKVFPQITFQSQNILIGVLEPPFAVFLFYMANRISDPAKAVKMKRWAKPLLIVTLVHNLVWFPWHISVPGLLIGASLYLITMKFGFEKIEKTGGVLTDAAAESAQAGEESGSSEGRGMRDEGRLKDETEPGAVEPAQAAEPTRDTGASGKSLKDDVYWRARIMRFAERIRKEIPRLPSDRRLTKDEFREIRQADMLVHGATEAFRLYAHRGNGIPALIECLRDEHTLVRVSAALALGFIQTRRQDVIDALGVALNDPDQQVREHAKASLRIINEGIRIKKGGVVPPADESAQAGEESGSSEGRGMRDEGRLKDETGVPKDEGRGTIDDKVAEGTVTELPPTDFEPSSGRKEKRWKPIRSGTPEMSPAAKPPVSGKKGESPDDESRKQKAAELGERSYGLKKIKIEERIPEELTREEEEFLCRIIETVDPFNIMPYLREDSSASYSDKIEILIMLTSAELIALGRYRELPSIYLDRVETMEIAALIHNLGHISGNLARLLEEKCGLHRININECLQRNKSLMNTLNNWDGLCMLDPKIGLSVIDIGIHYVKSTMEAMTKIEEEVAKNGADPEATQKILDKSRNVMKECEMNLGSLENLRKAILNPEKNPLMDVNASIRESLPISKDFGDVKVEENLLSDELSIKASGVISYIWQNLWDNAYYAVTKALQVGNISQGLITISTRKTMIGKKAYAEVKFSDNGIGIKKDDLARILRGERFTTKGAMGSGKGLPIVFDLIKRYDGTIEVESELGKGTTITIRLPMDDGRGVRDEGRLKDETGVPRDEGRGKRDDKVAEGTVTELPPTDFEPSSGRKEKRWKPIKSGTQETSPAAAAAETSPAANLLKLRMAVQQVANWLALRESLPSQVDLFWVMGSGLLETAIVAGREWHRAEKKPQILVTGGIGSGTLTLKELTQNLVSLRSADSAVLQKIPGKLNEYLDDLADLKKNDEESFWRELERLFSITRGWDRQKEEKEEEEKRFGGKIPGRRTWRRFCNKDHEVFTDRELQGKTIEELIINRLLSRDKNIRENVKIPEGIVYYVVLKALKIPDEYINVEAMSTTSLENFDYGRKTRAEKNLGFKTVVIFQHPLAMRRSKAAFLKIFPEYNPVGGKSGYQAFAFASQQSQDLPDDAGIVQYEFKLLKEHSDTDRIAKVSIPEEIEQAFREIVDSTSSAGAGMATDQRVQKALRIASFVLWPLSIVNLAAAVWMVVKEPAILSAFLPVMLEGWVLAALITVSTHFHGKARVQIPILSAGIALSYIAFNFLVAPFQIANLWLFPVGILARFAAVYRGVWVAEKKAQALSGVKSSKWTPLRWAVSSALISGFFINVIYFSAMRALFESKIDRTVFDMGVGTFFCTLWLVLVSSAAFGEKIDLLKNFPQVGRLLKAFFKIYPFNFGYWFAAVYSSWMIAAPFSGTFVPGVVQIAVHSVFIYFWSMHLQPFVQRSFIESDEPAPTAQAAAGLPQAGEGEPRLVSDGPGPGPETGQAAESRGVSPSVTSPGSGDSTGRSASFYLDERTPQEEEVSARVEWLIARVEKRLGVTVEPELRSELVGEFQKDSISEMVAHSFALPPRNTDRKGIIKWRIYQEAALLYSALPSLYQDEKHRPVKARIDQDALEQMRRARSLFEDKIDNLTEETSGYWQEELPRYRGQVKSFNAHVSEEDLKVSVIVVSLARRLPHLLRRIHEINSISIEKGIELIITIADPGNFTSDMLGELQQNLESIRYPSKVVFSQKNKISTNRNLGASVAKGEYLIFLDDDVKLVGPVIERLNQTLEDYPDLGLVSIPSYDHQLKIYRPGSYHLKKRFDGEVFIINRLDGMIMATRRKIVNVVPFVDFWPNYSEDEEFSRQIHNLGFLNAYIYAEDAYVVHEHVDYRATESPDTLSNMLIHEALSYYLEPEALDELNERLTLLRILKYGGNAATVGYVKEFWLIFRERVKRFFNGDDSALREMIDDSHKNEWIESISLALQAVVRYLEENKEKIIKFKHGDYKKKNLSQVKPNLGPLTYEGAERVYAERLFGTMPTDGPLAYRQPVIGFRWFHMLRGIVASAHEYLINTLFILLPVVAKDISVRQRKLTAEEYGRQFKGLFDRANKFIWSNVSERNIESKMSRYTYFVDAVVKAVFKEALRRYPSLKGKVALLATGSYGRKQLILPSDIDLKMICEGSITDRKNDIAGIREFYNRALGQLCLVEEKLGEASDSIQEDWFLYPRVETITKVLDLRYVVGSKALWKEYEEAISKRLAFFPTRSELFKVFIKSFDERLQKDEDILMGELKEPDLKEGLGGVYDFLSIEWLKRITGRNVLSEAEYKKAREAFLAMQRLQARAMRLITAYPERFREESNFIQKHKLTRNLQEALTQGQNTGEAMMVPHAALMGTILENAVSALVKNLQKDSESRVQETVSLSNDDLSGYDVTSLQEKMRRVIFLYRNLTSPSKSAAGPAAAVRPETFRAQTLKLPKGIRSVKLYIDEEEVGDLQIWMPKITDGSYIFNALISEGCLEIGIVPNQKREDGSRTTHTEIVRPEAKAGVMRGTINEDGSIYLLKQLSMGDLLKFTPTIKNKCRDDYIILARFLIMCDASLAPKLLDEHTKNSLKGCRGFRKLPSTLGELAMRRLSKTAMDGPKGAVPAAGPAAAESKPAPIGWTKKAMPDYETLKKGFIDELTVKMSVKDGNVSITAVNDNPEAQEWARRLRLSERSLRFILNNDEKLKKYYLELLNHPGNEEIIIRVSNALGRRVNAVRATNPETHKREIVCSLIFEEDMMNQPYNNRYAFWINNVLGERLFHELGHAEEDDTKDAAMAKEAFLYNKDRRLHELKRRLGIQDDIDRIFRELQSKGKKAAKIREEHGSKKIRFRSGYYFRFLDLLSLVSKEERDLLMRSIIFEYFHFVPGVNLMGWFFRSGKKRDAGEQHRAEDSAKPVLARIRENIESYAAQRGITVTADKIIGALNNFGKKTPEKKTTAAKLIDYILLREDIITLGCRYGLLTFIPPHIKTILEKTIPHILETSETITDIIDKLEENGIIDGEIGKDLRVLHRAVLRKEKEAVDVSKLKGYREIAEGVPEGMSEKIEEREGAAKAITPQLFADMSVEAISQLPFSIETKRVLLEIRRMVIGGYSVTNEDIIDTANSLNVPLDELAKLFNLPPVSQEKTPAPEAPASKEQTPLEDSLSSFTEKLRSTPPEAIWEAENLSDEVKGALEMLKGSLDEGKELTKGDIESVATMSGITSDDIMRFTSGAADTASEDIGGTHATPESVTASENGNLPCMQFFANSGMPRGLLGFWGRIFSGNWFMRLAESGSLGKAQGPYGDKVIDGTVQNEPSLRDANVSINPEHIIYEITKHLNIKGGTGLDIGSGSSLTAAQDMLQAGAVNVNLVDDSIAYSPRDISDQRIHPLRMDAFNLGIPDSTIDMVTFSQSLDHIISDYLVALGKPEGSTRDAIFYHGYGKECSPVLFQLFKESFRVIIDGKYILIILGNGDVQSNLSKTRSIEGVLSSVGFINIHAKAYQSGYKSESKNFAVIIAQKPGNISETVGLGDILSKLERGQEGVASGPPAAARNEQIDGGRGPAMDIRGDIPRPPVVTNPEDLDRADEFFNRALFRFIRHAVCHYMSLDISHHTTVPDINWLIQKAKNDYAKKGWKELNGEYEIGMAEYSGEEKAYLLPVLKDREQVMYYAFSKEGAGSIKEKILYTENDIKIYVKKKESKKRDPASRTNLYKFFYADENDEVCIKELSEIGPETDMSKHIPPTGNVVVQAGEMAIVDLEEGERIMTYGLRNCSALIAKGKKKDGRYVYILAHIVPGPNPDSSIWISEEMKIISHILNDQGLKELEIYRDGYFLYDELLMRLLNSLKDELPDVDVKIKADEVEGAVHDDSAKGEVTVNKDSFFIEHIDIRIEDARDVTFSSKVNWSKEKNVAETAQNDAECFKDTIRLIKKRINKDKEGKIGEEEQAPIYLLLGTSSIPYFDDSRQINRLDPLITAMRRRCGEAGITLIDKKDENLQDEIEKILEENPGAKIVTLAGADTIKMMAKGTLGQNKNVFLSAFEFPKDFPLNSYIALVRMLDIALNTYLRKDTNINEYLSRMVEEHPELGIQIIDGLLTFFPQPIPVDEDQELNKLYRLQASA